MMCYARDGKVGIADEDGSTLMCKMCKQNEFDNTKQGAEARPKCTKYINFFGFFVGEKLPVILSFAKTNYKEGKTMYSLAKVQMENMWHFGYTLQAKLVKNNGNEWYIINPVQAGRVSDDDKAFGMTLYKQFRNKDLKYDIETGTEDSTQVNISKETLDSSEF
jgi:hypothetical protein